METLRDLDLVRALPPGAITEVRAEDGDETGESSLPTMVVRFSEFNTWYEIDSFWEGQFLERTAPGAFKRTIKNNGDQVKVLFDHGMDPQIGNKVLGPIESLREESDSPVGEVPLFDTSYNRDLLPGLEAGVYGSSFRFRVVRDEWNDDPGVSDHNPKGLPERTIKEVRLFEFGPVTFPANPESTAGLRSMTDVYFDRLRARDPQSVDDELLARARAARTPELRTSEAGPAVDSTPADELATPEASDPAERHSDAPTETATPAAPARSTQEGTAPMATETMTVEERVARQSDIKARLAEIDQEYNGSELPEDVRSEWESLDEEYEAHERAVEDTRRRQERLRALADESGRTERGSDPGVRPAARRRTEDIYDLSEIRRQARSIDELPQLYRDNAMRAVEAARFPGVSSREEAQTHVARLLDSVDDKEGTLARHVLATGSPVYERAFGKVVSNLGTGALTPDEARALAVGSDSTGGFAVPFQLDPTVILTNAGASNPLRQIARVVQIVGKEYQLLTSDGVTATRRNEAAEVADNSPTLDQPTVKAERVDAFIPFSVEVDQDWTSMQAEMTTMLADAKNREEADSFINGDGVAPNAGGLIGTLPAGSNVTADNVTTGAIYALEDALDDRWIDNASFLAHRSVYNLVRQLANGSDGADLWVRLGDGQPPELIGYPAYRTSAMAGGTLGVGDRYLVLGDFSQFLIVDRIGMNVELVQHLFGANRRPTGQRGLLAIWRNNSKIVVPDAFRVAHKTI